MGCWPIDRRTVGFYVAYGIALALCVFGLHIAWVQRFDADLLRIERDLTPVVNRIDASVEGANRNISALRASAEAFFDWSAYSERGRALDEDIVPSPLFPGYSSVSPPQAPRETRALLIGRGEVPASNSDKGREVEMGLLLGRLFIAARKHLPDATLIYYVSVRDFLVNHPSDSVAEALEYFTPADIGMTAIFAEQDFFTLATPARNSARQSFWTPPYLDMAGQGLMCTAGAPVYANDGRFLGVIAIDLTLAQFSTILRQEGKGIGGLALVDAQLRLLGHPVAITAKDAVLRTLPELLADHVQEAAMAATIDMAATGFIERDGWLFRSLPVNGAPWRLVYYVERSQIMTAVAWEMWPFWLVMVLLLATLVAFERRRLVVSALRRITTDLAQARDEAQSANRAKSSFLGNVSHELRTPLNAILGLSELMHLHLFGPLGADKYDEYVEDIRYSGEHLIALIDSLLDLSLMEAGGYKLQEEKIELAALVDECRRILLPIAADTSIRLTMDVPEDFPSIMADRLALKQILLNLLSNAIKFTPAGGHVELLLSFDEAGGLNAAISDSGSGISAADRPHLFLPFSHGLANVKSDKQGAGLGLSIVKSLVELHGGSIAISSHIGEGSTFRVTLPSRRLRTDAEMVRDVVT